MREHSWIWLFRGNEISSCYSFLCFIYDEADLLSSFSLVLPLFKSGLRIVLLLFFVKILEDWVVLAAAVS